ncbi:sensor histidine kinase [Curvivirga sp.]|uniref:sensor histidine kinase n=1 Tax=Curvivirga sp. TaxID=2856848 RepID=UPI003B58F7B3
MLTKTSDTVQPSLRQRLLVGMAIGFIVIICIISIGLWRYAQDASNRAYDRLLAGAALSILERISLTPEGPSVDIPYSALQLIGLAKEDRVFYRVSGFDGQTLTGRDELPLPDDQKFSNQAIYYNADYSDEPMRFILQSRFLSGYNRSQWITVQIGQTTIARNQLMWELILSGLAISIVITIGGLLCVWYGINRALYPLIGIERELRMREPTDFSPLPSSPPREVQSLVKSINSLISRHKQSLDNTQNFIANVAHQTRTSLSALKSQLEVSLGAEDPKQLHERLQKIDNLAGRTIRLTNQLLSHAMVIHRSDKQPPQILKLDELIVKTLKKMVQDHVASEIEFSLDIQDHGKTDYSILGDEISLREALINLIENAINHGPSKNKIVISLHQTQSDIILKIDDAGPGIPKENRHEVFNRFSSFTNKPNHSGLGLAIVKEVMESHQADVELTNSKLGGLGVIISIKRQNENE